MAKPPTAAASADSDAFIREVDEAYRQDRLAGFWARWGRLVLIAIGLALIALAASLWWREERIRAAGVDAERIAEALRGLDLGDAEARATIDEYAAGDGGYALVARMVRAGLLAEDGDAPGALGIYRAVASDVDAPGPVRELARVRAARLSFDEAEPAAILAELEGLYEPDSPWFGVAGEMAAIAMLRAGNEAEAAELLAAIANQTDLPPSVRARASQLAASLSAAPAETTAAGPGAVPAAAPEPTAEAAQ